MKKLALVALSLLALSTSQANASPLEGVSSEVVAAVTAEITQVTVSIHNQVQQSINESIEEFFNEKVDAALPAETSENAGE